MGFLSRVLPEHRPSPQPRREGREKAVGLAPGWHHGRGGGQGAVPTGGVRTGTCTGETPGVRATLAVQVGGSRSRPRPWDTRAPHAPAAPRRAAGRPPSGGTARTSPGRRPCPPAGRRTGAGGLAGARSSGRSASCSGQATGAREPAGLAGREGGSPGPSPRPQGHWGETQAGPPIPVLQGLCPASPAQGHLPAWGCGRSWACRRRPSDGSH